VTVADYSARKLSIKVASFNDDSDGDSDGDSDCDSDSDVDGDGV
jgi:hypothetical protein